MSQTLCVFFFVIFAVSAWSQEPAVEKSELIKGPHQGHVEAASPFQIEILFDSDLKLKIYLLDADLKNEMVKNSEVGVFIKSGNVESEMTCQPVEPTHFECKQNGKKFKKGELSISAKRDGVRAEEVKVKIPFIEKSKK